MSISSVIECDSCGFIGMGMDHKSGGAAKARALLRGDGWKTGLKGGLDECKKCADKEMKAQSKRKVQP